MPEFVELIMNRKSVREYAAKDVHDEQLHVILDAARNAPSVHNTQPWHFGIVRGERKAQIAGILDAQHTRLFFGFHAVMQQAARIVASAPVAIAVWNREPLSARLKRIPGISHEYLERMRDYEFQSVAASIENLWIAATSLDLGMAWLGIAVFCEGEINALLNVQARLIAILALGYPDRDGAAEKPRRKRLEEIVSFFQ